MSTQTIQLFFLRVLAMVIPAAGCCAVVSHIIYRSNHPYKNPKAAKIIWLTVAVLGVGGAAAMGFVLLQSIYNFTSKSKVTSANYNAKQVCDAFLVSVADLDSAGNLPEQCEERYSGHFGDDAEEGTLAWYMNRNHSDPGYYVIVTDGSWHVTEAYWSKEPITPDKVHAYDITWQYQQMGNMFRSHSDFVGYYDYEAHRKAQHEFDRNQKLNEIRKRQEADTT